MLLCTLLRRLRAAAGFSAVEMVTVLSTVSVITAVAAPSVDSYLDQARMAKALSDEKVIAVALVRLGVDVGVRERRARGWNDVGVLVSDGGIPQLAAGGDARWTTPDTESLSAHLVSNEAQYPAPSDGSWTGGWRGPYVDGVPGSDPWGRRYAVNAKWMVGSSALDTVVLSAGSDGRIATRFEQDGLVAGDDDVMTLVASGGELSPSTRKTP